MCLTSALSRSIAAALALSAVALGGCAETTPSRGVAHSTYIPVAGIYASNSLPHSYGSTTAVASSDSHAPPRKLSSGGTFGGGNSVGVK